MHFNGRFVLNIAWFAGASGADTSKLISLTGLSEEELCQEDCALGPEPYNAIVEAVVEETGDPFFGLHAGENLNLAAAGLIGQITHTCETVKQALEYCCEFANLGCSALPTGLVEEKDHYKVTFTPNKLWEQQSDIAVRHTTDGMLAFTIREFHSLTRQNYYPLEMRFKWKRPKNVSEYERLFQCPLKFGCDEITMLLKKEHVEAAVVSSDYNLLRILVAHAEEKVAKMDGSNGFLDVVKKSIVNLVKPEFPTIDQVAGHLHVSVRTLQRKLKEEGKSYKEVLDELRRDFAVSYLRRPDLSISEIAYLLSYADASAFIRSFKRWEGVTPKSYRNSLANA